jgi:hypothetical protein
MSPVIIGVMIEVVSMSETYEATGIIFHHLLDSPTWALTFLRSFCQLKYAVIASSDFVTRVFSRVGL